ncbi:MAG: hypothetical protein M1812_004263 [Candelaria pacifica]|nr:MAG: hypothetical protein M1812_004263 [Candelaria pacifica]
MGHSSSKEYRRPQPPGGSGYGELPRAMILHPGHHESRRGGMGMGGGGFDVPRPRRSSRRPSHGMGMGGGLHAPGIGPVAFPSGGHRGPRPSGMPHHHGVVFAPGGGFGGGMGGVGGMGPPRDDRRRSRRESGGVFAPGGGFGGGFGGGMAGMGGMGPPHDDRRRSRRESGLPREPSRHSRHSRHGGGGVEALSVRGAPHAGGGARGGGMMSSVRDGDEGRQRRHGGGTRFRLG